MADTTMHVTVDPAAGRSRAVAYLVVGFLAEGIVGKFTFHGAGLVPQSIHLLLTACLSAGLVALAAGRRVLGGRALPVNSSVRPVQLCVLAMVAWGFLSSVAQVRFVAGNFAFWAVWAAHLAALWWAAPRLLQWDGAEERIRLIGGVLGVTLVLAVLTAPLFGLVRGRFGGPFANPTTMARLAVLAVLFWFARFVTGGGRDALSAAMGLAACGVLAFTRTRASVAAAVVGVGAAARRRGFLGGRALARARHARGRGRRLLRLSARRLPADGDGRGRPGTVHEAAGWSRPDILERPGHELAGWHRAAR